MKKVTDTMEFSKHNLLIKNLTVETLQKIKVSSHIFDKFVKINEKFIHNIVQKFSPTCVFDHEDYFQIALISLYNLIDKYDESRGKFSTFAYICIYNDVLQEINKGNKINNNEISIENFLKTFDSSNNFEYNEAIFDYANRQFDFENELVAKFSIEDFINNLEPLHKDIFERKVIKKMKHKEVAEELGLNYHTYKHIWHYSVSPKLKRLKEELYY